MAVKPGTTVGWVNGLLVYGHNGPKVYRVKMSANGLNVYAIPGDVHGGGKKGVIKGMNSRTSSRMIQYVNSLQFERALFVTLTYHANQTDPTRAYKDLRAWHKRLVRKGATWGAVWRVEAQKRGAMHYHVFCIDAGQEWANSLRDEWLGVTGAEGDWAARAYGVKVDYVGDLSLGDGGVMVAYFAKYAAKEGDAVAGKQWGILGRKYLDEVSETVDITREAYEKMVEKTKRAGGYSYKIDGGGEGCNLLCGSVGGSGYLRIREFVADILDGGGYIGDNGREPRGSGQVLAQ